MKKYAPAPFIFALLCLALPFSSVSCDGMKIGSTTATGLQLLTGYSSGFMYEVPANIYIIIFALSAFFGLVFVLLKNADYSRVAAICAGVGLGALVIFMIDSGMRVKSESTLINEVGMIYEFGFFLAAIALAAAIVVCLSGEAGQYYASALSSPFAQGSINPRNVPPPKGVAQQPLSFYRVNSSSTPSHDPVQAPDRDIPPAGSYGINEALNNDLLAVPNYYGLPRLIGISGQFAGQAIDLNQGQVVIGRDPRVAHLIYQQSSAEISRKHCLIYYDEQMQKFIVEDSSTNGTFIYPQTRLNYGEPVYLDAGSKFYLSNPSELFELRLS